MNETEIVAREHRVYHSHLGAGCRIAYGHRAPEDPKRHYIPAGRYSGFFTILHSAGMNGLIFSLSGILAGAGLLLLFHLLGGMGAGDVKLMAAVGASWARLGVFTAFLYSALIGGLYALVVLYRHGALRDTFYRLASVAGRLDPGEGDAGPGTSLTVPELPRLCYGLAISLGTVLAVLRPL